MKEIVLVAFFILSGLSLFSQKLVAEDSKTHKVRTIRVGKRLSVFATEDPSHPVKPQYTLTIKESANKLSGDWILIDIDRGANRIELLDAVNGQRKVVDIGDIGHIMFRQEDKKKSRHLVLAGFLGGICWTAMSEDPAMNIASAISISAGCLAYMAATRTRQDERAYSIIKVE